MEMLKSELDRPVVLVWNRDAVPAWRIVAYYRPSDPLYETVGRRTQHPQARLWVGKKMIQSMSGSPSINLPVPRNSRIIWLVHPDTVDDLARAVPLQGDFPVYYTDLQEDSASLHWGSLKFVPHDKWETLLSHSIPPEN
jgi:hypothetical protein